MPKALAITRADHTASELREVATRSNDAVATRRMLALALVLEGYKRGRSRQALRHGPSDPARLGSTLQRRRNRRARQPHSSWTETTAHLLLISPELGNKFILISILTPRRAVILGALRHS